MGILSNYKAIGEIPPPIDKDSITHDALLGLVSELLESGDGKTAIAKYIGVSRQSIYNYEKELREDYINNLSNSTFAEIFGNELLEIDKKIASYQNLLKGLEAEIVQIQADDVTGMPTIKIENKGSIRDYNDCNRVVANLMKARNEIKLRLTLSHSDSGPNLYCTISDDKVIEGEVVPRLAHEENVLEMVKLLKLEQPRLKNTE